jgi:hypothetical protein
MPSVNCSAKTLVANNHFVSASSSIKVLVCQQAIGKSVGYATSILCGRATKHTPEDSTESRL